jgi:hypothetical protein
MASSGSGGAVSTSGGNTLSGGTSSGGAGNAGSGGTVSSGGTTSVGGDSGGIDGSAGEGGIDGGAGEGGLGGEGGGPGGPLFDGTVQGKVINLWGYPQAGVSVTVSGVSASVMTKSDGSFTISGVSAPYDVSFTTVATNNAGVPLATHAWLFKGLRRGDPTFRVYRGGYELSANATLTQMGAPADATLKFGVSIGTLFGRLSRGMDSVGISYASVPLAGAMSAEGMVHMLSFFAGSNGLPTGYSAHGTHALSVSTSDMVSQQIDMTPPATPLASGTLNGTVVATGGGARVNFAWLQFADHGLIKLFEHTPTTAAFTYTVPRISGASVTMAAYQGNRDQGPYAVAHKNGLGGGDTATLTLPTPPSVSAPLTGASISSNTSFQWTGPDGVSVLRLQNSTRWIYVVTAEKSTTIPLSIFQSLNIATGSNLEFRVETHGDAASVDEATGPRGLLDEFSDLYIAPNSPVPGDGSFSFSTFATGKYAP